MCRNLVSRDILLQMINEHLGGLHECRNLRVTTVLHDPERVHGANWVTGAIRRSGDDHDEVVCGDAIRAFMLDLQQRFDIELQEGEE
ncbi:hypothetical protein [Chromobacterium subtsugae]|uniref:hypothetical protein n=1 Tax=Chromobacterium subtsugae TaxID=251747 RepID=UPI00128D69C7|nr:hypothetical protein [Chromobacterium subtsugae]